MKEVTKVFLPSAFSGCSSLESDFVNQIAGRELKYFGSTDFKTMGSEFSGCSSLTSLVWNFANLATNVVNASCFSGCSSLEKVIFKKPVVEIRSNAFLGIKPGAEVYMHKEAPAVFGGARCGTICRWQRLSSHLLKRQ